MDDESELAELVNRRPHKELISTLGLRGANESFDFRAAG